MFGAIVKEIRSSQYGFLTTEHSASSYGLPVFVPLNNKYEPNGEDARGSGEVGGLITCGYVGDLPLKGGKHVGWSADFRDAVLAAGFRFPTSNEEADEIDGKS